ncbi:MAG: hypothetical protein MJZ20_11000 [Bacteroidaceae bacterium]|nr:hypothetical protein [Bacteroidaceae bacterium]
MKRINLSVVLVALICGIQTINAQTDFEKKMAELKAREQMANFINESDLNTKELKATTRENPCAIYDNDEWYTAFGQKEGRRGDPQLANSLLRTLQGQISDKLAGKIQAITSDYFDQMDTEDGSYAREHIEGASQKTVEQYLAEAQEYKRVETLPDEKTGNIILYMSIRVRKQDLAAEMARGVAKEMAQNKESQVRVNEAKFRESAMKVFDKE